MKSKVIQLTVILGLLLVAGNAHAQLSASNLVGDFGLLSGSQAPPGIYSTYFLYNYDFSTVAGANGGELKLQNGDISAWAHAFAFSAVTKHKILGANYGATIVLPVFELSVEAPRLDLSADQGFGIADLWIQPIQLGWHKKQADITAWYAFYAPTGTYTTGGRDNHGLGQWAHELALGTTVFFDEKHAFHASTLSAFEFHSKKKDSDAKTGNVLTLEGGVGATHKHFLTFGMAYYAQWKISDDSGLDVRPIVQNRIGKNRNFALGPEAGIILPLSKDLSKLMVLNFRYEFETSARLDTKGNIVAFSATFKLL